VSGISFHETRMGVKFIESDIPRLIEGIERLANAVEKLVEQREEDNDGNGE
jgi:hypothetical protein